MKLTQFVCRQYQFRFWKRYIERSLYQTNSSETWNPLVGWKIKRKDPENFYYDENRPWTDEFQRNNSPSKKHPEIFVQPIKEWTLFKGDRVCFLV